MTNDLFYVINLTTLIELEAEIVRMRINRQQLKSDIDDSKALNGLAQIECFRDCIENKECFLARNQYLM
jgi:hypothetical protein